MKVLKNKIKSPKYKVGELVYYDRRLSRPRTIHSVNISTDPKMYHTYKLFLINKKNEIYVSGPINEINLSKTKPY